MVAVVVGDDDHHADDDDHDHDDDHVDDGEGASGVAGSGSTPPAFAGVTSPVTAINSAALGRLFNGDVQWTLRALYDLGERSKQDAAFAGEVAGVQEAITAAVTIR